MRQAIEAAVLADQDTTISLQIITTQPQITEVEPARSHVATFLSQPITFSFEDRRWTLEPAFLAALISFQPDGQGQMVAYFDTEPLEAYFQELAPQLDRQPINAWFELDETTWALNPTVASQDGYALDVQTAVDLVADQIRQPGSHQLNLPVTTISPAVPMANPEQLGIKELVSTNTSYFKGSSKERIQNIATAAAKFDGLVIPPGEIFSFNEHLGDVSPENGFAESLIIAGDRTAVGIGGGVCQVSTTAFRAAFYGGFEIVERWAHGYRVSWYEIGSTPGLDATIYSPLVDLKFRNDTDSYILIQTETDATAGTLTFDFYGTSANREVIVSEPIEENNVPHGPAIYEKTSDLESGEVKQVDWAVDGIDVTVTRTVKHGDQIIHQDTIFSRYRPWQAVYRVGL
jgi:vancomycin resistance protein YoaR